MPPSRGVGQSFVRKLAGSRGGVGQPHKPAGAAAADLIASGSVRLPRPSLGDELRTRGDHALADVPGLFQRLDIPHLRGLWPGGRVSVSDD